MAQQLQEVDVLDVQAWLAQDARRGKQHMQVVRPQQLSCWTKRSIQEGGAIIYGSTQGLGTFQHPVLPVDLNEGYPDRFVRKQNDGAPVEQVIGAIQHLATSPSKAPAATATGAGGQGVQEVLSGVHVVTFRNNLNKIFGTHVHAKDEWTVDACMHGNVLYLEIVKTEETPFPNQDLMTYYGYKFESVCTQPSSTQPKAAEPPTVDSTSEYAALVRLQLDGLGIVMAAEIDLTQDPGSSVASGSSSLPSPSSYLELKVHKPPGNPGQQRSLVNWKWSKWWLQSFLAGVPTLVLGRRDEQGLLTQVQQLEVQTLPAEARRQGGQWDAWQMLRFGTHVLWWFRACAEKQPGTHLRFQYCPGRQPLIRCLIGPPDGQLPARLDAALGARDDI